MSPDPTDETYNDAVSIKLAQIWAEMWKALVNSGMPKREATKLMVAYLRVTLDMVGR